MKMLNNCIHEEGFYHQPPGCDDWGVPFKEEFATRSLLIDIDTHRYKCTRCNEVMYYSQQARDYYEHGIKSDVPGLDE